MATEQYILDPLGSSLALSVAGSGHLEVANGSLGNLQPGSTDFCVGFWVYLYSKPAFETILGIYDTGLNKRSWLVAYTGGGTDRFSVQIDPVGTGGGGIFTATANNFGAPSLNTWYYIEAGRTGGNAFIAVNRGTRNTIAAASGPASSTAAFTIGCNLTSGTRQNPFDGKLDQIYYWYSSLPTSTDLNAIYNSGAGLSKRSYISGGYLTPYAAWELEEVSGSRIDWAGGRYASTSGTTTYGNGKPDNVSAVALSLGGSGDLRITDANWNLEPGSNDVLWCGWVKLASKAASAVIVAKYDGFSNNRSFIIDYDLTSDKFRITGCVNGQAATNVSVSDAVGGSPSTGVWYFVEGGRSGPTLFIVATPSTSSTRNARTTAAYSGNIFNSTVTLAIGCINDNGGANRTNPWIGQMGQLYYWQTTIPSSGNIDTFFNGGYGLSKREFIASGITTPNAAFEMEELSGNRMDWVSGKALVPNGTVSTAAGWPFDADFTTLQGAISYAQSYKLTGDEWQIQCYSGASVTNGSTANIASIPTNSTGVFKVMPASGHGHGGDFNAGAYIANAVTISAQQYSQVIGMRFESCQLSVSTLAGSCSNTYIYNNLFDNGNISITPVDNTFDDVRLYNNIIKTNALSSGITFYINSVSSNAGLTNLKVNHNTIIGDVYTADGGIYFLCNSTASTETVTGEMLNNVLVGHTAGDYHTAGTFNVFTITRTNNITQDSSGQITGYNKTALFVAPGSDNYTPITNGTAYRAGTSSSVTTDIFGATRHASPDIGAVESTAWLRTPTGGVVLGGAGSRASSYLRTPSGGVLLGGAASRSTDFLRIPSGGLVVGGAGLSSSGFLRVVSGGLTLGGAGVKQISFLRIPTGGLLIGGAGLVEFGTSAAYSLTGAIVARFDNDSDGLIETLRELVGVCYTDMVPEEQIDRMPYLVVSEISEVPIYDAKNYSHRIDSQALQIDCWHESKDMVEQILDAWENAYRSKVLIIADGEQIGLPNFRGQVVVQEDDGIWHGVIDLSYMIEAELV